MKFNYRKNRMEFFPETSDGERFIKKLVGLVSAVSNNLMAWYGDVEFDGKQTSGFVITRRPTKKEMEDINID